MKRNIMLVFLIGVAVLAACQSAPAPVEVSDQSGDVLGGTYTDISVPELQAMLAEKDFTFVNVHIPFEGDIPDTDLSIPYNEIEQNLDQLPAEKDAKIVLYCRSDRMSTIASEKLVELGYTNVWNLTGGMVAWEQEGLPLEGN